MEKPVRILQITSILVIIGITLNAQPVPFTEVPSNSTNFITMGDFAYFTSGDALWRTDGTAAGTFQLKSGFTGDPYTTDWLREDRPAFAREFGGNFFFVSGNGSQLWRSDGTSSGTILLRTSSANSIWMLASTDDYLFFISSDAATGQEIYRTDGTVSGTMLVRDINPGGATGSLGRAAVVNNELYFDGNDGAHGFELWKTNGTSAGTVLIKDINPGIADGFGATIPFGYDGLFFFAGQTVLTGSDPWVSDGSPEGTYMLTDVAGQYERLGVIDYEIVKGGYLYFVIRQDNDFGTMGHLWRTAGTPASTSYIKEIGVAERQDAFHSFRIYKDKLYFWHGGEEQMDHLWVSDGTAGGTSKIFSVYTIDGELSFFEVVNDFLLFTGQSSGYALDLYRSDGSAAGTQIFVRRKAGYRYPREITGDITKVGDYAFYADHDGPTSPRDETGTPYDESDYFHLFQTDAITARSMRTIFGVNTIGTDDIADFNGKVLFTTYDDYPNASGAPEQLWIYDPTSTPSGGEGRLLVETWTGVPGTHVSSIPVDSPPSSTSEITVFETPKNIGDNYGSRVRGYVIPPATGNYTFWIASDDQSELWLSTDHTPEKKRRIANVAGWTNSRQWDKYTGQKSAPVPLVGGKRYYVEALLKEGTGADHLAVGWQLPDGTLERPIVGDRLRAFNPSESLSPRVAITHPADEQSFTAPADIIIIASAYDEDGSISKVEFYNGSSKLGEDTSSPYSFLWNAVPAGNYEIIARATANDGAIAADTVNIAVAGSIACEGTGMIRQEFWTNVPGTRVSNIPTDREPDLIQELTMFEGPGSPVGDNYGSRIRGYICPPASGQYIFWIAGDDQVELSLSTDDDPANKRRIAYHTGWTNKREWTKYATQQSASIVLQAGKRYYIEALMKEGPGADHVSVGWQLPDGAMQRPIVWSHLIPFGPSEPPTACAGTGTISVETWTGIDGTRVSSIPVNSPPDLTGERTLFEAPTNVGSNFGSRFRGYVCVPVTGDYTFWIASDDHGELWLSTDKDPANKRRIAYHMGWTTPRQWTKYTTQQSAPIGLVAGQQYYIEALYKEDEGGDNMAVGWQLPDGTMERPIPGNRLSPFDGAAATTMAEASMQEGDAMYSQISIYPNPARSGDPELTIAGYEGIEQPVETEVEIVNMTGEVVLADRILCGGACASYLMNLNKQLVPGIYMVNMKTNGVRTAKRLLVK